MKGGRLAEAQDELDLESLISRERLRATTKKVPSDSRVPIQPDDP